MKTLLILGGIISAFAMIAALIGLIIWARKRKSWKWLWAFPVAMVVVVAVGWFLIQKPVEEPISVPQPAEEVVWRKSEVIGVFSTAWVKARIPAGDKYRISVESSAPGWKLEFLFPRDGRWKELKDDGDASLTSTLMIGAREAGEEVRFRSNQSVRVVMWSGRVN